MRLVTFRRGALLGMCIAVTLALTPIAQAAWSNSGSGTASAVADTMPSGHQPTARGSGTSVTLVWNAATFSGNQNVAGYVIRRFDATNGTPVTVGAGCAGTVTVTTCTEQNVSSGNWIYTDTPVHDNWTGGPSPASAPVTLP